MRLIDADLLKKNCKITGQFANNFQCVDLITLGTVIDAQPTIEAKPIHEGYIIETIKDGKMNRIFSCCGKDFTKLTSWMTPSYCPACGAELKGVKKHGNS